MTAETTGIQLTPVTKRWRMPSTWSCLGMARTNNKSHVNRAARVSRLVLLCHKHVEWACGASHSWLQPLFKRLFLRWRAAHRSRLKRRLQPEMADPVWRQAANSAEGGPWEPGAD